jgi:hypothetical protein
MYNLELAPKSYKLIFVFNVAFDNRVTFDGNKYGPLSEMSLGGLKYGEWNALKQVIALNTELSQ